MKTLTNGAFKLHVSGDEANGFIAKLSAEVSNMDVMIAFVSGESEKAVVSGVLAKANMQLFELAIAA